MVIGFTGRIGSGKDSVASIVQELYPELNWQIKGFADKLRQVASLLTGIPAEDMKKQAVKEQMLGDEWASFSGSYRNDGLAYNHGPYPSKDEFMDSLPFSAYSEECIEKGMTLRQLLQKLGTEAIRDGLHRNAWVNALMCSYRPHIERKFNGDLREKYYCGDCISCRREFSGWKRQRVCNECIDAGFKEYPNWLVTDCRFENEMEAITSRNGICIRIVRPDNPYPQSDHPSETSLDHIELLTIINDGNLEQLRIKVKEVFDPIVHRIRSGGLSLD